MMLRRLFRKSAIVSAILSFVFFSQIESHVYAKEEPQKDVKLKAVEFEERVIYHSPESPGYTAWVGFWQLTDGSLRCDFLQLTGPRDNPVSAVPLLGSRDGGATWTVLNDGTTASNRSASGIYTVSRDSRRGMAVLPDGTLVRGNWPPSDISDSGSVERSLDGGKTWIDRQYFLPREEYRTWPTLIRPLRDGRLVLFAGCWKRGDSSGGKRPDVPPGQEGMLPSMVKMMFVSADKGKTWSKPIVLMPAEVGACEESDFCELPNGDLFWIHRSEHYPDHMTDIHPLASRMGPNPPDSYWYSDRMQSLVRKQGDTFLPGKCEIAPFPHSGYPCLLSTREGAILHLATSGSHYTLDEGKTWHELTAGGKPIGVYYYPKALQLSDGKIICIGHRGSDDVYGTVDQAVMQQTFRLKSEYPKNAAAQRKNSSPEPKKELYHNEDCTNFFWFNQIAEGKAGEAIDHYIDVMADAGVTTYLCNTNSRRTNYRSQVWDSYWDGYDPAGPDDQPFLAPIPPDQVKTYRNGIGNMLAVHQQGIDYPARVIERCRFHGISPWITLRMNDCHYNDIPDHPFHGNFWKKNPQFCRKNCPGYFATCLDYAHPEVRDYFMALIVETLERYDVDGLELDFLREPFVFSEDQEAAGLPILNAWIHEVRQQIDATAVKRGHPIRLGVRVPSRPETALKMGFDAVKWAKEGKIDLLVVTPRWATLEFDMPIKEWKKMLGSAKTKLVGGLEIRYEPYPGGPASLVSPEMATAAAILVLSRDADAVYLFNYFQNCIWSLPVYQKTLNAMTSLDSLMKLPRRVGITFRDITAPGEGYQAPLPAIGKKIEFTMDIGPVQDDEASCELLIELAASEENSMRAPTVLVNGKPCSEIHSGKVDKSQRITTYNVPKTALRKTGPQKIIITGEGGTPVTILRLEMSLDAPGS